MSNATTTSIPTANTTTTPEKCASRKPVATQARQDSQGGRELTLTFIGLALADVGGTKTALVAAIRAAGLPGNAANGARVKELRDKFDSARRNRCLNQVNGRTAKAISALPRPSGRPAIGLPPGVPTTRLCALRKTMVTEHAQQAFRHGASGGTTFTVEFAVQTSDVNYSVSLGRNFDLYRGAYKGRGANIDHHRISVPADWRVRVAGRGLAMLGGLMTLDALAIEGPAGVKLYAAVWARQGRGFDVQTDRGFIAVAGGESFHSNSAEGAFLGLRRKGQSAKARAASIADMKSTVDVFITKYSKCDIDVSLDDARKSGSCEYGIRSWCASVGVDIARV